MFHPVACSPAHPETAMSLSSHSKFNVLLDITEE
jgi:hypothetical protein